jgi:hypothetical protein
LRRIVVAIAIVCCVAAASGNALVRGEADRIPFPSGYRDWTHVKSGLIDAPAHPAFARYGGIHHIYANPKAMIGYRTGNFPDGAILVYDLHTLVPLPDGSIDQGERRHLDVMVKDSDRFAATHGWGYEEFMANAPQVPALTPEARAGCAACHAARRAHGDVFSEYRE